jgi:hypothetical protein
MTRQKVTDRGAADAVTAGYLPDIAVRLSGALLALAVSAVHVADQGGVTALADPDWIGWGYRIVEIGGVLTALALLVPWPALLSTSASQSRSAVVPWSAGLGWAAGVLLGLGPFIAYLASRSIGVPGDPDDVGNWDDWLGTVSLFVEAALIALSLTVLFAIWQSSRAVSAERAVQPRPALSTARQPAGQTGHDASR